MRAVLLQGERWGGVGDQGWRDAPQPGQLPMCPNGLLLLHFWLQKLLPQQHLLEGPDFCSLKAEDEA